MPCLKQVLAGFRYLKPTHMNCNNRFLILASMQVLAECDTPLDVVTYLHKHRPSHVRIIDTHDSKTYFESQFFALYMAYSEAY